MLIIIFHLKCAFVLFYSVLSIVLIHCRIISLCPDLELCDVSGCDHVKISIVKTAITAVKLRNTNTFLRLVVGGKQYFTFKYYSISHFEEWGVSCI